MPYQTAAGSETGGTHWEACQSDLGIEIMWDPLRVCHVGVGLENTWGPLRTYWDQTEIMYEYLPTFCYACGVIGHIERACLLNHVDEREIWGS